MQLTKFKLFKLVRNWHTLNLGWEHCAVVRHPSLQSTAETSIVTQNGSAKLGENTEIRMNSQ